MDPSTTFWTCYNSHYFFVFHHCLCKVICFWRATVKKFEKKILWTFICVDCCLKPQRNLNRVWLIKHHCSHANSTFGVAVVLTLSINIPLQVVLDFFLMSNGIRKYLLKSGFRWQTYTSASKKSKRSCFSGEMVL